MHQQRQGGFILLVEDNPDDVELTERAFERGHLGNRVVPSATDRKPRTIYSAAATRPTRPCFPM